LQRCVPFSDKEFAPLKDPATREETLLRVEHGKPLVFGKNRDKGIAFRDFKPEIIRFSGAVPPEVTVYDETNSGLAYMLSGLALPEFPLPVGVLKETRKPAYEKLYYDQVEHIGDTKDHELEALLSGPDTWEIK
jgi:2-oxoglutarate ferredoxin oxidoreductase subunit beta